MDDGEQKFYNYWTLPLMFTNFTVVKQTPFPAPNYQNEVLIPYEIYLKSLTGA